MSEDRNLLARLADDRSLELAFGYEDEDAPGEWLVHRCSGNRNDREWTIVGRGETPEAALSAALSASTK